jgi:hypothetical protein
MVVLLFVLPSLWIRFNNLKKIKKSKNKLVNLASAGGYEISEFDFWNDSTIGIDSSKHRIFYIRDIKAEDTAMVVNLSEILKCRVINDSRSMNGSYTAVDKLGLILTNRDKNKPEIDLEFYSSMHGRLTLAGEVQLVEKWSGIVSKELAGIA